MSADILQGPGYPDAPPPFDEASAADPAAGSVSYRLPHSDEAEMALLSAILHDNRAYLKVAGTLTAEDFASRAHAKIYAAVGKLFDQGKSADPITLKQYFEAHQDLAEVGGFQYLMTLAGSLVSVSGASDYAAVIGQLARRRAAIKVAADLIQAVSAGGGDVLVESTLPSAVLALDALSIDPERGRGLRKSADIATDYLETVAAASRATPGQMLGVPTGLSQLDDMLCGLKRGGLTVLGARPSMGKSLTALHIAAHALKQPAASGKRPRHNVALFSLEMGGGDVIARRIAAITGIPTLAQRRPGVSVRTYDAIAEAAREIEDQPLWIDDRPGLTAEQIRLECRRLHRAHPLDLIIVDYLQIMGRPQQQGVNPVQQIGQMTRALRALAKETGAAVLLLSQLSRALESRDDKRPTLADLRESGDIEQDADAVLLLHREAYYLERQPPVKKDKESDSDFAMRCIRHETQLEQVKDKLDIIVAKNREGTVGPVRVRVDFARMTLADVQAEEGA